MGTDSGHGHFERYRLNQYDGIFAVSNWCSDVITKAYPEIQCRVTVTGFPIEYSIYDTYKNIKKVLINYLN